MDARERKHVSRVVPLAMAASTEAIKDAGLDPAAMSMEEKREIGVILGTGGGAQEFSEEQYRLWHSGHVKQVSLFCIPSGTMGTIPSEISMRFGFRGYSHVVTAGLHFIHRRDRLRLPAHSGRRAAHVSGWRRGFADHAGNHQGLLAAARADPIVEPCSRSAPRVHFPPTATDS